MNAETEVNSRDGNLEVQNGKLRIGTAPAGSSPRRYEPRIGTAPAGASPRRFEPLGQSGNDAADSVASFHKKRPQAIKLGDGIDITDRQQRSGKKTSTYNRRNASIPINEMFKKSQMGR